MLSGSDSKQPGKRLWLFKYKGMTAQWQHALSLILRHWLVSMSHLCPPFQVFEQVFVLYLTDVNKLNQRSVVALFQMNYQQYSSISEIFQPSIYIHRLCNHHFFIRKEKNENIPFQCILFVLFKLTLLAMLSLVIASSSFLIAN